MAGNTFGSIFKLTSFGESHGIAVGGIIDGCPAGLVLDLDYINQSLSYRRPGQSGITTSRNEDDEIEILSGIFEGTTLGTPIAFLIKNRDANPADYDQLKDKYRPSHADFTYDSKYGIRDHRGGGRSSARETAVRVAAGAIAAQLLMHFGISVTAWTHSIGEISNKNIPSILSRNNIYDSTVRSPDAATATLMEKMLVKLKESGDTTGGVISCFVTGIKPGLGEPVFDKLNADLAKAMFSINAVKGFEIGSGFSATTLKGSEHNDSFIDKNGAIGTSTNNSGGIQGGISNGEPITMNVAFKPVATIMKPQDTVDNKGAPATLKMTGRHDPCVVPRAVIIVESMAALVIADHLLRNRSSKI
jgi:chorismate synthase